MDWFKNQGKLTDTEIVDELVKLRDTDQSLSHGQLIDKLHELVESRKA